MREFYRQRSVGLEAETPASGPAAVDTAGKSASSSISHRDATWRAGFALRVYEVMVQQPEDYAVVSGERLSRICSPGCWRSALKTSLLCSLVSWNLSYSRPVSAFSSYWCSGSGTRATWASWQNARTTNRICVLCLHLGVTSVTHMLTWLLPDPHVFHAVLQHVVHHRIGKATIAACISQWKRDDMERNMTDAEQQAILETFRQNIETLQTKPKEKKPRRKRTADTALSVVDHPSSSQLHPFQSDLAHSGQGESFIPHGFYHTSTAFFLDGLGPYLNKHPNALHQHDLPLELEFPQGQNSPRLQINQASPSAREDSLPSARVLPLHVSPLLSGLDVVAQAAAAITSPIHCSIAAAPTEMHEPVLSCIDIADSSSPSHGMQTISHSAIGTPSVTRIESSSDLAMMLDVPSISSSDAKPPPSQRSVLMRGRSATSEPATQSTPPAKRQRRAEMIKQISLHTTSSQAFDTTLAHEAALEVLPFTKHPVVNHSTSDPSSHRRARMSTPDVFVSIDGSDPSGVGLHGKESAMSMTDDIYSAGCALPDCPPLDVVEFSPCSALLSPSASFRSLQRAMPAASHPLRRPSGPFVIPPACHTELLQKLQDTLVIPSPCPDVARVKMEVDHMSEREILGAVVTLSSALPSFFHELHELVTASKKNEKSPPRVRLYMHAV